MEHLARSMLAVPAAATAGLCFFAGGYFPGTTALAALVAIAAVVLRLTLAQRPWEGWSLGLTVSAGALVLFAIWTLVSAYWSGAPGRALIEFDRVLLYLAALVLFGLIPARAGGLGVALRWTAAAIACVCAVAVLTRLAPDVLPTSAPPTHERLAFPLTYWNALAALAAVGLALLLYVASSARQPAVGRVLAAAAFPAVAVTLYFTFSRAGTLAAVVGLALYALLGHPRGLLPALLAIVPPTAFVLVRAYDAELLAGGRFDAPIAAGQRGDVLTSLAICVLLAGILRAVLLLADRRLARVHPSPGRSRAAKLVAASLVVLLAGGAVAIGVPARIDRERRAIAQQGDRTDLRERLANWGGKNRSSLWRVSIDEFQARSLHGTGAGTFQRTWERARPRTAAKAKVRDGHSLYLEVLSELGWPGLLFLAVALGTPLALAGARLRGPGRHAHAGFLAAGGALVLHAGLDWDWEVPALWMWFFGVSGIVLAGPALAARAAPTRLTRLLAGLACLVLSLTPVLIYRSERALERSLRAFHAGDCATATDAALDSLDALSVRAEPFEILGYCDARAGHHDLAVRAMRSAVARDPDAWVYAYGLAVTQALAGEEPGAAVAAARRLNPLDERVRSLARALGSRSAERRRRAAARAPLPYE